MCDRPQSYGTARIGFCGQKLRLAGIFVLQSKQATHYTDLRQPTTPGSSPKGKLAFANPRIVAEQSPGHSQSAAASRLLRSDWRSGIEAKLLA
jgi:hypothetical protein